MTAIGSRLAPEGSMTPRWIVHEGTAHLMRPHGWDGMAAVTWCGLTIRAAKAEDFREPKTSRGEQDCRACGDAAVKGGQR